jgi:hypothetical protein
MRRLSPRKVPWPAAKFAGLHGNATELAEQILLPKPAREFVPTGQFGSLEGNLDNSNTSSRGICEGGFSITACSAKHRNRPVLESLGRRAHSRSFSGTGTSRYAGPARWLGPPTERGRRAITHRMSDFERDQRLDLECLRLASDLIQLASAALNGDLKAHCLRVARALNDQVEQRRSPP